MAPNSINREKNATPWKSYRNPTHKPVDISYNVYFSVCIQQIPFVIQATRLNEIFCLLCKVITTRATTTKAQCMNAIQYAIHLLELKLLHKQFPRFPFSFVNLLKLCVQTQTLPLFARISLHSRIARTWNNSVYANKCCYYVSNWKVFEQLKLPFRLEWENSLSEVVRFHCIPLCQSVLYWFIQRFVWFTAIKGVSDIFHGFICLSSSGWEIVPMSIIG